MQVRDKVLLFDRQTNQQTDNQPNKGMITIGVEEGGPEALHGHLGSDHRLLLPADSSSVVRVQVLREKKVKKSVTIFVIYWTFSDILALIIKFCISIIWLLSLLNKLWLEDNRIQNLSVLNLRGKLLNWSPYHRPSFNQKYCCEMFGKQIYTICFIKQDGFNILSNFFLL